MAELTQLKRKRTGYKGVIRKLCKKIEEKLLIIEFEFDEHSQYDKKELKNEINATNAILIEKESIIKDLDGKILDYLEDDEEFELEIEQATEYEIILKQLHERVRSQITPQERETVKRTDSLVSTSSERNIIKTNVKLPTLTLSKFNGDPTKVVYMRVFISPVATRGTR